MTPLRTKMIYELERKQRRLLPRPGGPSWGAPALITRQVGETSGWPAWSGLNKERLDNLPVCTAFASEAGRASRFPCVRTAARLRW
jgi:hypothetical protein